MKYIVGIGNPGKAYEKTRHNIGFRVIAEAAAGWPGEPGGRRWATREDWDAEALAVSEDAVLLRPRTFVNLTGRTIRLLRDREKARLSDILVVCDDVNLFFGKLRFRTTGSGGGHHGLESVIAELGSQEFPRLRLGVGRARLPKDLTEFVLKGFDPAERERLPGILEDAAAVCRLWALEGPEAAMRGISRIGQGEKK